MRGQQLAVDAELAQSRVHEQRYHRPEVPRWPPDLTAVSQRVNELHHLFSKLALSFMGLAVGRFGLQRRDFLRLHVVLFHCKTDGC
ncbi:MAG TPA: hypothetical protein DCF78_10425 [Dehalococcoidia bacterium]|nr:hypothetical protein [Dehalococcoidia bacterium]